MRNICQTSAFQMFLTNFYHISAQICAAIRNRRYQIHAAGVLLFNQDLVPQCTVILTGSAFPVLHKESENFVTISYTVKQRK